MCGSFTLDEYKLDRSGHQRQRRQAGERVILEALAVWQDGSHEVLPYQIATGESEAEWNQFFSTVDRPWIGSRGHQVSRQGWDTRLA